MGTRISVSARGRQGRGGRVEGRALPSVLVLLLYIFRRLPTRFSFHALRLAASREQKGERGKKRENKKEKKTNEKGRKENVKVARDVTSIRSRGAGGRSWASPPPTGSASPVRTRTYSGGRRRACQPALSGWHKMQRLPRHGVHAPVPLLGFHTW